MLSSEARVTELASCWVERGAYIMGGARHWRRLEHASAFDLFLRVERWHHRTSSARDVGNMLRITSPQQYSVIVLLSSRVRNHCWVNVKMTAQTDKKFRTLENRNVPLDFVRVGAAFPV